MTKSTKGKLTLNSGLDNETDKVVSTYVAVKGDIDIALTKPAVAAQQVYMYGAKHTATLTGGFVGLLMNAVDNAGVWEDKDVNLVLGGEVPSAILTLSMSKGPINISGATKWNGKKITNTTFVDKKTSVWDGSATDANGVLTASQLATLTTLGDMNFYADIDLNNKDWSSVNFNVAGTINGNDKTIKNLKKNPLLGTVNSKLTVKKLKIAGADIESTMKSDIGVLGKWTADVDLDISDVTITGMKINPFYVSGALAEGQYRGGIFGAVRATTPNTIKFTNVSVSGEIDAFWRIGGLVGYINGGNTTFKNCKADVNIKQSYDSGKSMTMNYATIGGFVGSVINSGNITIDGGSATAPTHAWAKREFLSDTTVDAGDFYSYTQQQPYIGFSGANCGSSLVTIGVVKINGTTYEVPDFKTKNGKGFGTCTPLYDFATKKNI
jgi:hypothetical protein